MPITAANKHRYPANWPDIRAAILKRADGRCEWCGVRNYAAGWRDAEGRFCPTGGNRAHDEAGCGELTYAAARELVDHCNQWCGGLGPNGERGIVIVLTIAHIEPVIENCADWNLAALCQKCHNSHDARMRARNAARTLRGKKERHQEALSLEA